MLKPRELYSYFGGELVLIGCECVSRYPQVDMYMSDVYNDRRLYLVCDECNEAQAEDI